MVEIMDIVQQALKDSGADTETQELWKSIIEWYEKGGPDAVEEGIRQRVREIKSIARKQFKETKEVMPLRKKKKKTRR
uniref:Uncharacterized protein n=1 Tax=candidate division WOR-3 bacterium TaxID=2052148 RepID=A0A7V3KND8_UNCW3